VALCTFNWLVSPFFAKIAARSSRNYELPFAFRYWNLETPNLVVDEDDNLLTYDPSVMQAGSCKSVIGRNDVSTVSIQVVSNFYL
jgi:hypothetical protein